MSKQLELERLVEKLLFYSLVESAKANDLEPYAYLNHVLKELPYADALEKLECLLPWAVKASQE